MMTTKGKKDYIPEAIRYLCVVITVLLGLFSIIATGGGGGDSSGSSFGNILVSEARVTVLSTTTGSPIKDALVEAIFFDQDTNVTEPSTCGTDATGSCTVAVDIAGQYADEVSLTVSQADYYTTSTKKTLNTSGSTNVLVYMTPR